MDGVALASVISSAAVGLGGLLAAVWSVHRGSQDARNARIEERRASSYLEVAKIVARERQWLKATVSNLEIAVYDHYGVYSRIRLPEPLLTDRAVVSAHLAAFGSREVQQRHREWRDAADAITDEHEVLAWNHNENPGQDVSDAELVKLIQELSPAENVAGGRLEETIARELGHR